MNSFKNEFIPHCPELQMLQQKRVTISMKKEPEVAA
jgi:hypothetical protein